TDKNAVEKQRRGAFRMNGLTVDDPEVLAAQSPSFAEVLNVRVTRDGALYKGSLATDQKGFAALTAHTLKMAAEHLDAIRDGKADIAPAYYRLSTPCAWCDWRPACLFDARLDAPCVRRFASIKGDEVLEKVVLEAPDMSKEG
ncbi:MAG: hypothetical protein IKE76_02125, partial [Clostridia bacterium]|nr:hypothetical protein [Clostridia bacterium]